MGTPTEASTPPNYDRGDWELVHDDGFVYKRKKRRLDPTALFRAPDPAPDPTAEMKEKRYRKRKALLELKNKYQREIGLWEHLSNTFKAMEEAAKFQNVQTNGEVKETQAHQETGVSIENQSGSLLNEVLLQVEAQEALIRDLSYICDVAESLCNVHEENAKLQFIDLPIWSSPRKLISSLCED